jgi:hypothetical protein
VSVYFRLFAGAILVFILLTAWSMAMGMSESLISRIQLPEFAGFVALYGLFIGVVARVFKDLGTTLLPASRAGVLMLLEHVFAICTAAVIG